MIYIYKMFRPADHSQRELPSPPLSMLTNVAIYLKDIQFRILQDIVHRGLI